MKMLSKMSTLILVFVIVSTTMAQDACPTIVQDALNTLGNACAGTARNQACYGNGQVLALTPNGDQLVDFSAPGDIEEMEHIQSLNLSELDEALGYWGMVLLQVQANLPDTLPGQNVTVLLFGDVEMATAGNAMDAFYFRSGVGTPACSQAPNGIMIQTPEGVGTINLSVNNVQIEMGSTAYLSAEPEGDMVFALLEGGATLGVDQDQVVLAGGQFSTVTLDADLNAIGAPADPLAIEGNLQLPDLPVKALPRDISEYLNLDLSGTDGVIIPRSGNWRYQASEPEIGEGCPAALATTMFSAMTFDETAFVDFGGKPFVLQDFMVSSSGVPLEGEFTNPEPNLHLWTMNMDGSSFEYSFRIVSETQVNGSFFFDISELNCVITVAWEAELTE